MSSGGKHITGPFHAGSFAFEVRCSSAALRDRVEELFQDLRDSRPGVVAQEIGLMEEVHQGEATVRLVGAIWNGPPAVPPDIAFDLLVGAVNQLALDAEPGLLHLHAGVVARSGRCVIVSAKSGTGKSVLTAQLVNRGWDYLTDETAALSADGMTITGFHKPLTIKRGGRSLVPEFAEKAVYIESSERTSWQVPATRVGSLAKEKLKPTLIVILDRDRDTRPGVPSWTRIEPADAVASLLQHTLDASRHGRGALRTVAGLVQQCVCVHLRVGSPEATAELVSELFEIPSAPAGTAKWIEHLGLPGILPESCVSSTVASVLIDGRAAVLDSATCRVASFDEAGTMTWLALHDADTPVPYSAEVVREMSFVHTLRSEGFLVGHPSGRPTA